MKIKNFPQDAKITFLGEIFKFNHLKSWNIKLGIHNGSELSIQHSRLSSLPAFARGRCLNPSDGQYRKRGYTININIQSNEDWKVKVDPKNRGYYFEFDFNRGSEQNPDILHIRIPQIELARILFFHNTYFAKNCIDHGIFSREFFVDPLDQTTTVIHVLPHRTFPMGQFNNEGIRRLLAWILLDENARQSYESIAYFFKLEAQTFEEKTSWRFHFTPPQLVNISLKMIGQFDSVSKEYIVFEIIDLHKIKTSLPSKVLYESSEFKSGKSTDFGGNSSGSNKEGNEPFIDDDIEGDSNSKLVQIDIPQTSLSFSNPIETRKVVMKTAKGGSGGHGDVTEYEEVGVGTDEPTINGNGPQGEFNGLEDDSDVIALYMQRFEAFKILLKKLISKHGLKYEEKLHYLQKVGRSRLHRTLDGNNRCLLEFKLFIDNQWYVILEIDTSDNAKPLSTLVVQLHELNKWNHSFKDISKTIVQNSLRWPSIESLKVFGTPNTLKHPKHLFELTESDNEFSSWLQRMEKILNLNSTKVAKDNSSLENIQIKEKLLAVV